MIQRGKHIAGKCNERHQNGSGNGEGPTGMEGHEDRLLAGASRAGWAGNSVKGQEGEGEFSILTPGHPC